MMTRQSSEIIRRFKVSVSDNIAYQNVYDLFLKICSISERLERTLVKSMLQKLNDTSLDLLIVLYRFNTAAEKSQHLAEVCTHIETLRLLLRLIKDFALIPVFYISELDDHVEKIRQQINEDCRISNMSEYLVPQN